MAWRSSFKNSNAGSDKPAVKPGFCLGHRKIKVTYRRVGEIPPEHSPGFPIFSSGISSARNVALLLVAFNTFFFIHLFQMLPGHIRSLFLLPSCCQESHSLTAHCGKNCVLALVLNKPLTSFFGWSLVLILEDKVENCSFTNETLFCFITQTSNIKYRAAINWTSLSSLTNIISPRVLLAVIREYYLMGGRDTDWQSSHEWHSCHKPNSQFFGNHGGKGWRKA